jgi:hypothetical protein
MPLIDLKTTLKSLKFGKDRPYEGSSNQPYIQSSIPEGDIPTSGGPDFILRGGILAPISAAKDVSRLTQMFFDLKSPNGFQFITKQNILSRTSVQTQASSNGGAAYAAGAVNQGVYLPSSTLAQAGVGFTGTHLNLLGVDPSSPMSGITNTSISNLFNEDLTLGLKRYETVVKENPNGFDPSKNRLYELSTKNGLILSQTPQSQDDKKDPKNFFQKVGNFLQNFSINSPGNGVLMKYSGGPGSILGVGQTIIPFADQRTGTNNIELQNLGFFKTQDFGYYDYRVFKNPNTVNLQGSRIFNPLTGVSSRYLSYANDSTLGGFEGFIENYFKTDTNSNDPLQKFITSVYQSGNFKSTEQSTENGSLTFTQDQLVKQNQKGPIQDFRKVLIDGSKNGDNSGNAAEGVKNKNSSIISLSPDYRRNNIENRLNLGNPGSPKNVFDYVAASGNGVPEDYKIALDKITAGDIYSDTVARHNRYKSGDKHAGNDLVKFSIGVIQNNTTGNSNYMHFRAFIDSFSDSYTSDWNSYNYVGRGDKFYNYTGFERTINLSFTVFAQSKAELIPMYKKLNYLASSLTPDYSKFGFMKGNLHKMSIGGYLFNQVGIIKSLTYDIPEETPWEIGINNEQEVGDDTSVKELPHMIKVTNLSFIPIQHFLPRVANPNNQSKTRYIALAASTDDNDTNYTKDKTFDFGFSSPQDQEEIDSITL